MKTLLFFCILFCFCSSMEAKVHRIEAFFAKNAYSRGWSSGNDSPAPNNRYPFVGDTLIDPTLYPFGYSSIRSGKDFALFFAIDAYDDLPDLQFSIRDCEAIARELSDSYGFQTELLRNPTQEEILKKLDEYKLKVFETDAQLLVFFNGLGGQIVEPLNEFFISRDGKHLFYPDLQRKINSIHCQHILCAIDADYSGYFNPSSERLNYRFEINSRSKTRVFLASSMKRSPAESVFCIGLLEGLRKNSKKDFLDVYDLYNNYLSSKNPKPIIGTFEGNERGSSFVFFPIKSNPASPPPKIWAVIVGIEQYERVVPPLKFAKNDAYSLSTFLQSVDGGALPKNQVAVLTDYQASKDGILKAMKTQFEKAGQNDIVLFYFSGHGADGAFIPQDFDGSDGTKLLHSDIQKIINKCPAKFKIIIADACSSGSYAGNKGPDSEEETLKTYYEKLKAGKGGLAILASSKSTERSRENDGKQQGVFSYYLVMGLSGEADQDGNRIVSLGELFNYVYEQTRQFTNFEQTPVFQGNEDQKQMPFVIVHKH